MCEPAYQKSPEALNALCRVTRLRMLLAQDLYRLVESDLGVLDECAADAHLRDQARCVLGSQGQQSAVDALRLGRVTSWPRLSARRAGPLALVVFVAAWTIVSAAGRQGHLVLLGGGPTPAVVFTRTLDVSGGRSAIVAVLPQTYLDDSIGDAAVDLWKKAGAREVFKLKLDDMDRARAALDRATLIWMPGGFQGLLMKTLTGTPIPGVIRRRYAEGATIGGASAGAAAMSATMLADESTPEGDTTGGPRTMQGLGLWPAAIVSPHFTERRRSGPLVAILQDHPGLIGVGIDEGTAIFISNARLEVAGRGTITILEAAGAPVRTLKSGGRLRLTDNGFPSR